MLKRALLAVSTLQGLNLSHCDFNHQCFSYKNIRIETTRRWGTGLHLVCLRQCFVLDQENAFNNSPCGPQLQNAPGVRETKPADGGAPAATVHPD